MVGLIVFEYGIGAATVLMLHPYINFMRDMSPNQVTAVALMAGALVCARSPASAVAIVREMRAEGAEPVERRHSWWLDVQVGSTRRSPVLPRGQLCEAYRSCRRGVGRKKCVTQPLVARRLTRGRNLPAD